MKKIALFLVFMLIIGNFNVSYVSEAADETIVSASLNPATGEIELSGSTNGITTIMIVPYGTGISSLTDDNLPTDYHQIEEDGVLDYSIFLPEGTGSGKYTIYVTDENGEDSDHVLFFLTSVADVIVAGINPAWTFAQFKEYITVTNSPEDIGIDSSLETNYLDALQKMHTLYRSYTDSVDFYNKYKYCLALADIEASAAADIPAILVGRQGILGIDYVNDYQKRAFIDTDAKSRLDMLLSEMNYLSVYSETQNVSGESGFKAVLLSYGSLAAVNTSTNWMEIKEIYEGTSYLKALTIDTNTGYSGTNANNVFMSMSEKTFTTPKSLIDNFNTAVQENPLTSDGGDDGYSGGGGNGGGGKVSIDRISGTDDAYDDLPKDEVKAESVKNSLKLPEFSQSGISFIDVGISDWYTDAVIALSSAGIINGYENGAFLPNNNISRAEFVKLIVTAFSLSGEGNNIFNDVEPSQWYAEYISAAEKNGIIKGNESGAFLPDGKITREDAVVMLSRVVDLSNVEYLGIREFLDVNDISLYAKAPVGRFYQNGLVQGSNKYFRPKAQITRAEACQMLYNLVNDMKLRQS